VIVHEWFWCVVLWEIRVITFIATHKEVNRFLFLRCVEPATAVKEEQKKAKSNKQDDPANYTTNDRANVRFASTRTTPSPSTGA
jgi:hypothetical protein